MADAPATSPPQPKLAQQLAERISRDILASDQPIGAVFGSETDLRERYKASRASLREAIRILEREGLAQMRRGPRGGLTVVSEADRVVAQTLANFLSFTDISFSEILEARAVLERLAVRLAMDRVSHEQLEALRQSITKIERADRTDVSEHMRIRHIIAEATQNPALALFLDTLSELTTDILYFRGDASESLRKSPISKGEFRLLEVDNKRALVDAIGRGDVDAGERQVQRDLELHLKLVDEVNERNDRSRQRRSKLSKKQRLQRRIHNATDAGVKLPEMLARTILAEIRDAGWPIGERLGSEPQLIESYNVSRAALREAIRLLERDSVVEMRRGSGGGLFVTSPAPDHAVNSAVRYLAHMKLSPTHYVEVRSALETRAAQLAAERITDDQATRLAAANERLLAAPVSRFADYASETHILIGRFSGNRAIALLNEILVTMTTRSMIGRGRSPQAAFEVVKRTHPRLVKAIISRDVGESRRAMLRHIEQALTWPAA